MPACLSSVAAKLMHYRTVTMSLYNLFGVYLRGAIGWLQLRVFTRLATDPVVMRSSPVADIYVVHCWLINPNKFNLLSWLLAYSSDK